MLQRYQQCEAQRLLQGAATVYLISRFNEDDATLEDFWSQTPQDTGGSLGAFGPYYAIRLKKGSPVAEVQVEGEVAMSRLYAHSPDTFKLGGHAEEAFLSRLAYKLEDGTLHNVRLIEIYVSRIPCADQSAAWAIRLNDRNFELPLGCGPKMYKVMEATPGIAWRLAWDQSYPSPQTQANCLMWTSLMNSLPNVTVKHRAEMF